MKLKYYLRGLGTGILFATLVLFISYTYHNTDAQVKKRAKELGMIETTESASNLENITTKAENDTSSGDTKPEDNTKSEGDTTTKTADDETKSTTASETTKSEQNTTTPQAATVTETTSTIDNIQTQFEFSIVSGMNSQQVAGILQSIGAIDSATSFDQYLVQNGYADRIKVGNFKIQAGASYADIAILITN